MPNLIIIMSDLSLQTGSHRQHRRKHSFRQLPGGTISGSSTNPETIGRNRRRQKLPPLKAELERIRCNKANRISSRIRKLKREPAWQILSKTEQEAAVQQVRDGQEARYRKDKKKVQEEYKTEVEDPEAENGASNQPLRGPPPTSNTIIQPQTPTPLDTGTEIGSTGFNDFNSDDRGSSFQIGAIQEAEREDEVEEIHSGEMSEKAQDLPDSPEAQAVHSTSPVGGGSLPQSSMQLLIAALEQSQNETLSVHGRRLS